MREQTSLKKFEKKESDASKKPVLKYQAGTIQVAVWEQPGKVFDGKQSTFFTLSMQRGYKDESGEWKNTQSFRANDIPVLRMLLSKAYEDIKMSTKDDGEA